MVELLAEFGKEELAKVYLLKLRDGDLRYSVECVESVQPPIPRSEKWVILVSTLFGCPVSCPICDAGGLYHGRLSADEILTQILFIIERRYGTTKLPVRRLKVQFARMGEPAFNPAVLDVIQQLPSLIDVPVLMPSVSTIAPKNSSEFFERLLDIKNRLYSNGNFQLQFSIHTTDQKARDFLIPAKKWDFAEIAEFGRRWFREGDRKITLNFAASTRHPIEPAVLKEFFDTEVFLIKITPLNPTERAVENRFDSLVDPHDTRSCEELLTALQDYGFDVILSIGALEENSIGSNCGQYLTLLKKHNLTTRNYRRLFDVDESDIERKRFTFSKKR